MAYRLSRSQPGIDTCIELRMHLKIELVQAWIKAIYWPCSCLSVLRVLFLDYILVRLKQLKKDCMKLNWCLLKRLLLKAPSLTAIEHECYHVVFITSGCSAWLGENICTAWIKYAFFNLEMGSQCFCFCSLFFLSVYFSQGNKRVYQCQPAHPPNQPNPPDLQDRCIGDWVCLYLF